MAAEGAYAEGAYEDYDYGPITVLDESHVGRACEQPAQWMPGLYPG